MTNPKEGDTKCVAFFIYKNNMSINTKDHAIEEGIEPTFEQIMRMQRAIWDHVDTPLLEEPLPAPSKMILTTKKVEKK